MPYTITQLLHNSAFLSSLSSLWTRQSYSLLLWLFGRRCEHAENFSCKEHHAGLRWKSQRHVYVWSKSKSGGKGWLAGKLIQKLRLGRWSCGGWWRWTRSVGLGVRGEQQVPSSASSLPPAPAGSQAATAAAGSGVSAAAAAPGLVLADFRLCLLAAVAAVIVEMLLLVEGDRSRHASAAAADHSWYEPWDSWVSCFLCVCLRGELVFKSRRSNSCEILDSALCEF